MWGQITLLTAGFFSLSVIQYIIHQKQLVKCSVRHRTPPKWILNLFWQDSHLVLCFSLHRMGMMDDAVLWYFLFPLGLGYMVFGARTTLVELWTLLKSLKCDCIKVRRNHKHIHILIIRQAQSREGAGRKQEIPLKSFQHWSKHKRGLKWEHAVPSWRNYQYYSHPCLEPSFQFYGIYLLYQIIFHFFLTRSPRSLLQVHTALQYH